MKRAPSFANESARLETLRSYGILDTAPESAFDDLVRLASLICGTPIALVSLVDENRQWCKASFGMSVREIPRESSFCSRAIEQSGIFVVSDLQADVRFRENPFVIQDPKLRFYAGAPLIASDGHALGTLCVIDIKPHHLSAEQRQALEALARQVVDQFELRKMNQALRQTLADVETAHATIQRQQMKLVESTKMKSLGEMAGGVAHEINSPLAIICGKATQLIEGVQEGRLQKEDVVKSLLKIEATTLRIAKIVKGLLAFSRASEEEPFMDVALKDVVEDALELAGERFRSGGVRVEIGEIPASWRIECRATQITQVLLNLLSNAFDAAQGNDPENQLENRPEKWIRVSLEYSPSDSSYEISVSDSGPGIPEDIRAKIMEPFFTTKSVGKGTGLGLSISKGIIEGHQGSLELDTLSKNTKFDLILPACQGKPRLSIAA